MKPILIVVLVLLTIQITSAQTGFIKSYDFNYPAVIFTNISIDQDTLIVAGLARTDTFPHTTGILFAKIDTVGQVLSHQLHLDSLGSPYTTGGIPSGLMIVSDHSGYIMLGNILSRQTGMVMKLDNEGNQEWVKEYTDSLTIQDLYTDIIEVPDGYLIIGHKAKLDFWVDGFVMKIDYEGNQLWQKYYGENNERSDYFEDIIKINDNEYVIGGSKRPATGARWQDYNPNIRIFGIDSLGNELWSWEGEDTLEEMWMRGIHQDTDGNWVYGTVEGEFTFDGALRRQGKLVKRDADFNLIYSKTYDEMESDRDYFNRVISLNNEDWLALGTNYEAEASGTALHGWMLRLDENGDSLWTRKDKVFPDSTFFTNQYLHSAVELSSGSIIAAGYYEADFQPSQGILIKVNESGCIDTTGCVPLVTSIEEEQESVQIEVYPNPAIDQVTIEVSGIDVEQVYFTCYDLLGKQLLRSSISGMRQEVSVEQLLSGIYIYQISTASGVLESGKIIVTK